jgi:hypothetical protein
MNGILSDLDDFLAPTAECIKMIPEPSKKGIMKPGGGEASKALVQMDNDFDFEQSIKVELNNKTPQQQPDLIKTSNNAETGEQTAKISLQDCLACSGCVTSAETVLIQ